jgi:hypothetical protein
VVTARYAIPGTDRKMSFVSVPILTVELFPSIGVNYNQ